MNNYVYHVCIHTGCTVKLYKAVLNVHTVYILGTHYVCIYPYIVHEAQRLRVSKKSYNKQCLQVKYTDSSNDIAETWGLHGRTFDVQRYEHACCLYFHNELLDGNALSSWVPSPHINVHLRLPPYALRSTNRLGPSVPNRSTRCTYVRVMFRTIKILRRGARTRRVRTARAIKSPPPRRPVIITLLRRVGVTIIMNNVLLYLRAYGFITAYASASLRIIYGYT